jgi:hypothetical protein
MNNWLFGGQPQRGPTPYQPQNLIYGQSPWYGGAGTSATDPSSVPGYQGPPGPSGTQGGVKGPNPWPGQQKNPFDAAAMYQQGPAPQQPQNTGGVTITINPGGQTTSSSPPAQVTTGAAGVPPPAAPPPPPPEPVNEWGRTAAQQQAWQMQMDWEQAQNAAAIKAQDAATAQQQQDTQDLINRDEILRQGLAAYNQFMATEQLKIQNWQDQWNAYQQQLAAMPEPDWNDIPAFRILRNELDPALFQNRGQLAQQAMAGPVMPQMPVAPGGPDFAPINDWTLQASGNPEVDAILRRDREALLQKWSDLNQMYETPAEMKPIRLNLPQAHKVNMQDYASLLPSEQALVASGIKSQGMVPDDWLEALRRSTPAGRGFSGTGWG